MKNQSAYNVQPLTLHELRLANGGSEFSEGLAYYFGVAVGFISYQCNRWVDRMAEVDQMGHGLVAPQ